MQTHSLYSQEQNATIAFFDKFNKEAIKAAIIKHLQTVPNDTIEHCKEYSKRDVKKYYGNEIVNFYEVNPKNNKPSLVITRANKTYYKPLI